EPAWPGMARRRTQRPAGLLELRARRGVWLRNGGSKARRPQRRCAARMLRCTQGAAPRPPPPRVISGRLPPRLGLFKTPRKNRVKGEKATRTCLADQALRGEAKCSINKAGMEETVATSTSEAISSRATASESTRWGQLIFGIICMVMIANLQYGWTL